MSVHKEIDSAIAAHGQWKVKLRAAIETGKCESTPQKVKMDNNCSFGKWLHYRLADEYKNSELYQQVVDLHARFHHEAGNILELALTGQKEEAQTRLKLGGDFTRYSGMLTRQMKAWQETLS